MIIISALQDNIFFLLRPGRFTPIFLFNYIVWFRTLPTRARKTFPRPASSRVEDGVTMVTTAVGLAQYSSAIDESMTRRPGFIETTLLTSVCSWADDHV